MLRPVRTYDAVVDLGHSLYTVRVVYFAPIPGVLHAPVCGRFRLECLQAGWSGHPLLIDCLSPGFLLEAPFKSVRLCHSLHFFSFSPLFRCSLLSVPYLVECRQLCVWCECVWRAKAEPAEGCSVLLQQSSDSQKGNGWPQHPPTQRDWGRPVPSEPVYVELCSI